ncbi:MAG TPA: CmpA/NrtA family ABC transporter substrate-binding protein [Gammaproteobacteria bacterium]
MPHTHVIGELEKRELLLGFIPLTDCAPLVVAQHLGLYAKYGLEVTLSKETSWANIRDKVALGILDAAQMLATMPLAMTLGIGPVKKPTLTALVLDLNGNAITISESLYRRLEKFDAEAARQRPMSAALLKRFIEHERAAGAEPLTFASVFPTATHTYELRYWLASAGIDPLHDIRLEVVPPPQMVARLAEGHIDGCCVGEPWNSMAVAQGVGHIAISGYEIWNNRPEKVLGVTEEWAMQHPNTHRALLLALLESCRWLDEPRHRLQTAALLAQGIHVGAPEAVLRQSLIGQLRSDANALPRRIDDFHVFHRHAANFPWHSHAHWYLAQMVRWGELDATADLPTIAARCLRTDLYRAAASALDIAAPEQDYKTEGSHRDPYSCVCQERPMELGPDRFCDGRIYEAAPHATATLQEKMK